MGVELLIAAGVAAAVSAASYTANYLMTPKPGEPPPVDRGRYDDIRIQYSGYNSDYPILIGKGRMAGQVVWSTGIDERVTTTPGTSGGKGGPPQPPSPTVNSYNYYTSLGIMFCKGPAARGITRLWADDRLVFDLNRTGQPVASAGAYALQAITGAYNPEATYPSDREKPRSHYDYIAVEQEPTDPIDPDDPTDPTGTGEVLAYEAESGILNNGIIANSSLFSGGQGVKLNPGGPGGSVQVSGVQGFGPDTRFTFRYIASGQRTADIYVNGVFQRSVHVPGNSSNGHTNEAVASLNVPVGAGNVIQIINTWNEAGADLYVDLLTVGPANSGGVTPISAIPGNIRTYRGTENQPTDSLLLELAGGDTNVYSANRGLVGLYIEEWLLDGPRQVLWTAEIDEGTETVGDAVRKLYGMAGVAEQYLVLDEIAADPFYGLLMTSVGEAREAIGQLQVAYNFDLVEADGKIRAVKRDPNALPVCTITEGELDAHDFGAAPGEPLEETREEERALPRTFIVGYIDPALDYHGNQQSHVMPGGAYLEPRQANLSVVLPATDAKQLARRLLMIERIERKKFTFTLPWYYLNLIPSNVVKIVMRDGTEHTVRIVGMEYGMLGPIKCEAVRHDASAYQSADLPPIETGYERPPVDTPANSYIVVADVPPLRADDARTLGRYIGMCGRANGRWTGGVVYKEESAANFERYAGHTVEATIGRTLTAMPEFEGSGDDAVSTVDVGFWNGTLDSLSADDFTNGLGNILVIGRELVRVKTVTPLALDPDEPFEFKARLSYFKRYFQGTAYAKGSHTAAGEDVMLLDSAVQFREDFPRDIGISRQYRVLTNGQRFEDGPTFSLALEGNSLKSPAVKTFEARRSVSGDWLFFFEPGDRDILFPVAGEELEIYRLEILNGGTVVRTQDITVADSAPVLWTPDPSGGFAPIPTYAVEGSGSVYAGANAGGGQAFLSQPFVGDFRVEFRVDDRNPPERFEVPGYLQAMWSVVQTSPVRVGAEAWPTTWRPRPEDKFIIEVRDGYFRYYVARQGEASAAPFYESRQRITTQINTVRCRLGFLDGSPQAALDCRVFYAQPRQFNYNVRMQQLDFGGAAQTSITARIRRVNTVVNDGHATTKSW
ncbi:MAG TPA: phage tail protein [Pyrinomonadaceae bacterium]